MEEFSSQVYWAWIKFCNTGLAAEGCVPIRANAVLSTMTIDTALNHESTSVGNPGLDDDDK